MAVEFFTDHANEHRWRTQSANGRFTATSGEGYEHAVDAKAGAIITLRILLDSLDGAVDIVDQWLTERGDRRSHVHLIDDES